MGELVDLLAEAEAEQAEKQCREHEIGLECRRIGVSREEYRCFENHADEPALWEVDNGR